MLDPSVLLGLLNDSDAVGAAAANPSLPHFVKAAHLNQPGNDPAVGSPVGPLLRVPVAARAGEPVDDRAALRCCRCLSLAARFGVGTTTAWRYVQEAIDLLAATAPTLQQTMRRIRRLAFAILDGTLIAIDRIRGSRDRLHYSGKRKRHGVNVQVIADPHGRLIWLSPTLPGSVHDLKAARTHGIVTALTHAAVATLADKAGHSRAPARRRRPSLKLEKAPCAGPRSSV